MVNEGRSARSPNQIFRIDHYLGKGDGAEPMALRFANALRACGTPPASITSDHRRRRPRRSGPASYYDRCPTRLVQNHAPAPLCLPVAMEPRPRSTPTPSATKLKTKALKPIGPAEAGRVTVRSQYEKGASPAVPAAGYQELGRP